MPYIINGMRDLLAKGENLPTLPTVVFQIDTGLARKSFAESILISMSRPAPGESFAAKACSFEANLNSFSKRPP